MRAAVYHRYGGPEVVRIAEVETPRPKPGEILVQVAATGVTTGDWRLRAAAFPGVLMQIAGRLMFGLRHPRNPVLGGDFAGRVAALGTGVTGFAVGDRVFGFSGQGAHAEYLTMPADKAVLATPDGLNDAEAAALPFGGLAAQAFLEDFAQLRAGERVLVIGASGGVGAYAVQIAAALGAEVTGMASAGNLDLVRSLGAAAALDYRAVPPEDAPGRFDVVLDTVGAASYPQLAARLEPGGRFVPLNFGLKDLWHARRARRAGHRVVIRVNDDTKDGLKRLVARIEASELRPVLDRVLPFEDIRAAHAHVETRHRSGAVVVTMDAALTDSRAA